MMNDQAVFTRDEAEASFESKEIHGGIVGDLHG